MSKTIEKPATEAVDLDHFVRPSFHMSLEDKIKRMAESIYVARRKHPGKAADFLLSRGWTPVGNGLWRSPKNKQDANLKRALKHERKWDTNAVIAHVLPDWPNEKAET